MVAVDTVLNGSHDTHGANADRQGRRHKAVDKLIIPVASCLVFQPASESLKLMIQIDNFSCKRSDHHGKHNGHGACRIQRQPALRRHQHF